MQDNKDDTNELHFEGTEEHGGDDGTRNANQLTQEEWLEALLKLNPWAGAIPLSAIGRSSEYHQALHCASIDRWSKGKKTWNAWAQGMITLKEKGQPQPEFEEIYDALSWANFFGHRFDEKQTSFSSVTFPGRASFNNAEFFDTAFFNKATFHGDANFTHARFIHQGQFLKTNFLATAIFKMAIFQGRVFFSHATFNSNVSFAGTAFHRRADFVDVNFKERVIFQPYETPDECMPSRFAETASFERATFDGAALFRETIFQNKVSFCSAQSRVSFSVERSTFARVPDFIEATFHEPPRLDDCEVPNPINEFQIFRSPAEDPRPRSGFLLPALFPIWRVSRDKDEHARLRKLRKMAADAKDHENELKFNGYEIDARRFWIDHPYKNPSRFWLGWFYGLLSNYGQSAMRPFSAWALLIIAFWGIILVFTPDHSKIEYGTRCHISYREIVGESASKLSLAKPYWQALFVSLRNASVIGQPDPAVSRRMYGCLYGMEQTKKRDKDKTFGLWPVVPPAVTAISALQSVLSAVLLFLLGLGLRNTFRMK